jgi:hypothetical protein
MVDPLEVIDWHGPSVLERRLKGSHRCGVYVRIIILGTAERRRFQGIHIGGLEPAYGQPALAMAGREGLRIMPRSLIETCASG